MAQVFGEPLADFTLPLLAGGSMSLAGALAGRRGAVVVFWAGVCSHCVRYDGYLNGFAARHPELVLLAVAARQGEGADALRATIQGRGLTFPLLHDGERRVAHAWLVEQTPRVFLVDAERRLLYRGAIDNFKYPHDPAHCPYLEEAIADVLAGRAPRRREAPSFGCPIESVYYGT